MRSSSTAEDGAEASFAGQYRHRRLGVVGLEGVVAAAAACREAAGAAAGYARAVGAGAGRWPCSCSAWWSLGSRALPSVAARANPLACSSRPRGAVAIGFSPERSRPIDTPSTARAGTLVPRVRRMAASTPRPSLPWWPSFAGGRSHRLAAGRGMGDRPGAARRGDGAPSGAAHHHRRRRLARSGPPAPSPHPGQHRRGPAGTRDPSHLHDRGRVPRARLPPRAHAGGPRRGRRSARGRRSTASGSISTCRWPSIWPRACRACPRRTRSGFSSGAGPPPGSAEGRPQSLSARVADRPAAAGPGRGQGPGHHRGRGEGQGTLPAMEEAEAATPAALAGLLVGLGRDRAEVATTHVLDLGRLGRLAGMARPLSAPARTTLPSG